MANVPISYAIMITVAVMVAVSYVLELMIEKTERNV